MLGARSLTVKFTHKQERKTRVNPVVLVKIRYTSKNSCLIYMQRDTKTITDTCVYMGIYI